METLQERVTHLLQLRGLSQAEARRRSGFANAAFINDIVRGAKQDVRGKNLTMLAVGLQTTEDYLLGKSENPDLVFKQSRRPLVRSFDPDAPEPNPYTTYLAEISSDFPPDAIRELVAKGGMGAGQVITTSYVRDGVEVTATDAVRDDYWKFPADFVRSTLRAQVPDLLAVECQGDSMEPTIQAGERVWVDTAHKKPSPDGIYAIRDTLDEIVVKRLELTDDKPPRVAVISDNRNHGRKVYGLDEIMVVGRVVCSLRLF